MSTHDLSADYWQRRYEEQKHGWDLGSPTPALLNVLDRGLLNSHSHPVVGVPGCGFGHDVIALAERGFNPVGVDFAPLPLQVLTEKAAQRELRIETLRHDVLHLGEGISRPWDAAWEYTCFCAIDPWDRAAYVRSLAAAIRPGGLLVALLFPLDGRPGGPPFAIDTAQVLPMFRDAGFSVAATVSDIDSHLARKSAESLIIFERTTTIT